MPRYAVIAGSTVENVIVASTTPTIPGRTVVALTTEAVSPGDTYNGSAFVSRVPSSGELVRIAAPTNIQRDYATARQWVADAASTYAAAVAGNRALTAAEQREFMRRFGIVLDRLLDLIALQYPGLEP